MADAAFFLLATHTCQIWSPPPVVGGQRDDLVQTVPDMPCLPLDYVSAQIAQRLGLEAPARLRQTYIDGTLNIERGSYLVFDSGPKRYPIKATEPWDWGGNGQQYTHLVVEATEA